MLILCEEWSVTGKSIRCQVREWIDEGGLLLKRLLFRHCWRLVISEAEDLIGGNLVSFVSDSAAIEIPAAVLSRVIDFGATQVDEKITSHCSPFVLNS
jgi:hypothetical protein